MNNTIYPLKTCSPEELILDLAGQCLDCSKWERPELTWLKTRYERLRKSLALRKSDMDSYLYRKMTGHLPEKPADTLKIRYWRTGHHVPINRESCRLFGEALALSPAEQNYLLQAYLDKSLDTYSNVPCREKDPVYWTRRSALDALVTSYLESSHPLPLPRENFRHFYYMDALRYIRQNDSILSSSSQHICSVRYDTELQSNLKLLGEISRKTMIRHLIILGLPDLNPDWMSRQLELFGYLPLSANHTLTGGEHLDRLLTGLLETYEKQKKTPHPQLWFRRCCQDLDAFFQQRHNTAFRFMYFKSLE